MEPLVEETQEKMTSEPISVFQIIMKSGPVMLLLTMLTIFLAHKWIQKKRALVDEAEEIDPEVRRARLQAVREARERQQREWEEASKKKQEEQAEKEKKKRAELKEKLEKYGTAAGGRKLGTPDDGYLPLSGGGATSSYKPPKRSACSKGGCGK
ncbi:translation initiation factor IF-2-like isoform X2 [Zerene cesonia]|nr:translation initiation factor IF-2-like isoform X2 [Zerene cesonia]